MLAFDASPTLSINPERAEASRRIATGDIVVCADAAVRQAGGRPQVVMLQDHVVEFAQPHQAVKRTVADPLHRERVGHQP